MKSLRTNNSYSSYASESNPRQIHCKPTHVGEFAGTAYSQPLSQKKLKMDESKKTHSCFNIANLELMGYQLIAILQLNSGQ